MSFDFFIYFIIFFQHVFLFLITDSYFLIPPVIGQVFIFTADLVIFIGMPTKEAKEDIEAHPLTAKSKITKCSI